MLALDLKSRLWDCAQTLRGSAVDRTDWKAYILPLLFFKRIKRRLGRGDRRGAGAVRRRGPERVPGGTSVRCARGVSLADDRSPDERAAPKGFAYAPIR